MRVGRASGSRGEGSVGPTTAELVAEPHPAPAGAGQREPRPAPGRIGAGTEVGATLTRAGRAPGLGDPRDGHAGPGDHLSVTIYGHLSDPGSLSNQPICLLSR